MRIIATKRANGKWRTQVLIGTNENGKRFYKSFEADTKEQADYAALTFKLGKGKRTEYKNITLRAAMQAYIASKRGILSPATVQGYEVIERNFGDFLDTPISLITCLSLQTAINDYAQSGEKDKPRSAKSVRNAYGFINAVLRQNNVSIDGISLPQKQETQYATPFDAELTRIFEAVKGTNLEIPVLLATFCSLRRGEICGLRFSDVDFERKTIRINRAKLYINKQEYIKAPKTQKSKRLVFASDYLIELIRAIPRTSEEAYIFPYSPNMLTKRFPALLKKHGLSVCRFHDLRHSFASVLYDHGIDLAYIQATGGWSSDRVMKSVYIQHSEKSLQSKSAVANSVFEALMQPSATQEPKKNQ